MRRCLAVLALAGIATVGWVATAGPAIAHKFGTEPLQDVRAEARGATTCEGLTAAELAAMVLAPTWPETGAGPAQTPSPMTLGRHDTQPNLYSPWNNTPRAFWHPGVGAWQLDILALNMAAFQKVNTQKAANKVANHMASEYCGASGGPAERRREAFDDWVACGSNQSTCEDLYQEHYCSGNDNVCGITTVDGVGRLGGMRERTCYWRIGPPPWPRFTCWFVDPDKAEGYTGSWQQAPKDGNSISPLSFAFYSYWPDDGDPEYRHWLERDTGYNRGEVWAARPKGRNPRDNGVLEWTDLDVLCDATVAKGNC